MKVKTFALVAFLCFAGVALYAAEDANMGTWKLNEAKSMFGSSAQRNHTVAYEAAGDSIKVTIDGVGADGKALHNEWTGKFDGKEYAVTSDPNSDMRWYKKVNAHTLMFATKKDGKVVQSGRIVVAPDGKSRTVTSTTTDSMGKKNKIVAVYEKQ